MLRLRTSSDLRHRGLGALLALAVALALSGCGAAPFPGSPESSGVRDVPFVETFNFDFPTGDRDRGSKVGRDRGADLRIFSHADLANLLSAANVSADVSGGVLSGYTVFGATPIPSVLLELRDFDGNVLPDVFYNGLGGVPDFGAEEGTAAKGSFTVFNVPPGETFVIASKGGLGVGRVASFAGSISVKPVTTVPVIIAEIGLTGAIQDWVTLGNVFPVSVSGVGLQGDTRFSDDQGFLQVTPLVGFRFKLPSSSQFMIKGEAEGHVPTYQLINTYLADLNGAVDLTRDFFMLSDDRVAGWLQDTGITPQPGTGMILGRVFTGDNPQVHGRLSFSTFDGQPVGQYRMGRAILYDRQINKAQAEGTSYFVAFDLPPGPIFVRGSAYTDGSGSRTVKSGATVVSVFPDGATLAEVRVASAKQGESPVGVTEFSLRGSMTLSDLSTPVSDVVVDIGGYSAGPGRYDGPIRERTVFSGGEYAILSQYRPDPFDQYNLTASNLPIAGDYVARVGSLPGRSNYVDTYQLVGTSGMEFLPSGGAEVVRNLQVFTRSEIEAMAAVAGVQVDPGLGILVGRILNSRTLGTTPDIELRVYNDSGIPVGDIRYLDSVGLPQRLQSTSLQGEFVVFNVPPGLVLVHVVSHNDTGSRTVRVYPGGVTAMGSLVVGDAPEEQITLSGVLRDLDGMPVGGTPLTFRGEPSRDLTSQGGYLTELTKGDGTFQARLRIAGDFIVSANPLGNYLPTHNLAVTTGGTNKGGVELVGLSQQRLAMLEQQLAASGNPVVQDPNLGVVIGEVQVSTWKNGPGTEWVISGGVRGPTAVASSIMNGDDLPDLLVANGDSDDVSVYFGTPDGRFATAGTYPVGLTPVDLVGTEVNGDAVGDILVLNQGASSGDVTVLLGTIRGSFREDRSRRLLTGSTPIAIELGDMDADGDRDDVVVLNAGGSPSLSIFIRGEDRRYVEADYSPFPLDGTSPSAMVVRDVHKLISSTGRLTTPNPRDDVIVSMELDQRVETYANTGAGLVREQPLFLSAGTNPSDILRLDLDRNGDVKVDRDLEYIVLSRGANQVQVWDVLPTGSMEIVAPINLDPGCNARRMKVANINSDRWTDLLVMCPGTNTVTVYLGQDLDPVTQTRFIYWQCNLPVCRRPALSTGGTPSDVVVDNFDEGGGSDLVITNQTTHDLTVFSGTQPPQDGIRVQVADVDGNSVPDLFYLDSGGNLAVRSTTDLSGRFIALNVPPGNVWASAVDGSNGNRRFMVRAGEASFARMSVLVGSDPDGVLLQGKVTDAVGASQSGIEVTFSATGGCVMSTEELAVAGVYDIILPANLSDTMVRLREPLNPAAPCTP
ncbi:MAG: VCBS repeat-containing protein [Nitrospirota bacterium]|nr:VCBS repeat-containing protein [Nitrospirota bacterium]